eukprot:1836269-Rhodomonas_salina.1
MNSSRIYSLPPHPHPKPTRARKTGNEVCEGGREGGREREKGLCAVTTGGRFWEWGEEEQQGVLHRLQPATFIANERYFSPTLIATARYLSVSEY